MKTLGVFASFSLLLITQPSYAGLFDTIEKDAKKVEHGVSNDIHKVEDTVKNDVSTVAKDVGKVVKFTESQAKKTAPKVFNKLSDIAGKLGSKLPGMAKTLIDNRASIERAIQLGLTEGKPAEDILNFVISEVPVIGPLVDLGGNEVLDAINAIITADLALQGK
ncbi:MAG: hypothetical protein ACTHJ4_07960 [Candidatus Nucleicultricaceae bacterium]